MEYKPIRKKDIYIAKELYSYFKEKNRLKHIFGYYKATKKNQIITIYYGEEEINEGKATIEILDGKLIYSSQKSIINYLFTFSPILVILVIIFGFFLKWENMAIYFVSFFVSCFGAMEHHTRYTSCKSELKIIIQNKYKKLSDLTNENSKLL